MSRSKTVSVSVAGLTAALALAACGGGNDGGGGATAASPRTPGSASVKRVQGMNVLVDARGSALYSADQERGGKLMCTGSCTSIWEPAVARGAAPTVSGTKLAAVKRPDGSTQLTFKGSPLYRFTEESPGQLKGDGVKDSFGGKSFTWHTAAAGKRVRAPKPAPSTGSYGY